MELTGTIKVLFDEVTFDSGFNKRECVITTEEQYPQDIKVEMVKDKARLLDSVAVGDRVTAKINLRGNEWQGKYFVNITAWAIDKVAAGAPAGNTAQPTPEMAAVPAQPVNLATSEEDDLPF